MVSLDGKVLHTTNPAHPSVLISVWCITPTFTDGFPYNLFSTMSRSAILTLYQMTIFKTGPNLKHYFADYKIDVN